VESSIAELKSRILELLKRDEEFRYAVAGLIGLDRVLNELRMLREDFNKLYEKSLEHDKRFETIEKKLLEHDKRFEVIEEKLLEHDKRLEAIEKKLLEHDKRLEAIERKLLEHDKRFEAIERKLLEHDERFEAIEGKLVEHDERFEELSRSMGNLEKRVGRVELEVGALNEAFYCRTLWEDLKEEIQGSGEKILLKRRNARVDGEEVDLLVVTDRRVYIVEAKTKPRHRDVRRLLAKAEAARRLYEGKEVVPVLVGSMIGGEVEEYALEKGVRVYQY